MDQVPSADNISKKCSRHVSEHFFMIKSSSTEESGFSLHVFDFGGDVWNYMRVQPCDAIVPRLLNGSGISIVYFATKETTHV